MKKINFFPVKTILQPVQKKYKNACEEKHVREIGENWGKKWVSKKKRVREKRGTNVQKRLQGHVSV